MIWRILLLAITLTRGARHLAFLPGGHALVVLRGEIEHKNLWYIDLDTGAESQLTKVPADFDIQDFDISPDGHEVVLERAQQSSDVVLVDIRADSSPIFKALRRLLLFEIDLLVGVFGDAGADLRGGLASLGHGVGVESLLRAGGALRAVIALIATAQAGVARARSQRQLQGSW